MERFYKGLLHERQTPARALRAAQIWLRHATAAELGMVAPSPDMHPFAGIHYWGAFMLPGV